MLFLVVSFEKKPSNESEEQHYGKHPSRFQEEESEYRMSPSSIGTDNTPSEYQLTPSRVHPPEKRP